MQVLELDIKVTNLISNLIPHNRFLDFVFNTLSGYGSAFLIWLIIAVLLIFFEEKKHKEFIWGFLGSILVAAGVSTLLKSFLHRIRPLGFSAGAAFCPTDFSLPSTHAAVAFAAAVILAKYDSKRSKIYYAVAALVGLSRIYLGCHFLLDVVIGGLIGYLVAKLILKILPGILNRLGLS